MAVRNAVVRARVNEELKSDVEAILDQLGLTTSEAIHALFSQIRLHRGLPFEVKIPNQLTRSTLQKSLSGEEIERFESPEDLYKDLED